MRDDGAAPPAHAVRAARPPGTPYAWIAGEATAGYGRRAATSSRSGRSAGSGSLVGYRRRGLSEQQLRKKASRVAE
ncbi:hypothetical protein [Streptomyces halstedii]|uniref:hypothetical protein n=1 Tax=Streptomyces halstedii TaxID=1944 RepID=UPI00369D7753